MSGIDRSISRCHAGSFADTYNTLSRRSIVVARSTAGPTAIRQANATLLARERHPAQDGFERARHDLLNGNHAARIALSGAIDPRICVTAPGGTAARSGHPVRCRARRRRRVSASERDTPSAMCGVLPKRRRARSCRELAAGRCWLPIPSWSSTERSSASRSMTATRGACCGCSRALARGADRGVPAASRRGQGEGGRGKRKEDREGTGGTGDRAPGSCWQPRRSPSQRSSLPRSPTRKSTGTSTSGEPWTRPAPMPSGPGVAVRDPHRGSYSNVVGLPVAVVYGMCKRAGLLIS